MRPRAGETSGAALPLSSKVRYPTFVAIGVADVALPAARSIASIRALEVVGGVGGAGLIAVSALDLKNARTLDDKLDALNSIAWGTQALFYLSSAAFAHGAAAAFGVTGALLQGVVGARRVKQGLASDDRRLTGLGALDIGSGAFWLTGTVLCSPFFLGGYALLMIGREAYVNEQQLRRLLQHARHRARRRIDAARATIAQTVQAVRDGMDEGAQPQPTEGQLR